VFCCNMTMLGPILPVSIVATIQDVRVSSTSVVLAHVTFTSSDYSERWESNPSGPTKTCSRRCTSGCALSQDFFYWYPCTFEALEQLYGMRRKLRRKDATYCNTSRQSTIISSSNIPPNQIIPSISSTSTSPETTPFLTLTFTENRPQPTPPSTSYPTTQQNINWQPCSSSSGEC
jgi:hypothetical protein